MSVQFLKKKMSTKMDAVGVMGIGKCVESKASNAMCFELGIFLTIHF